MIAKISSSNTLYGALAYNQNKLESDNAKVILTNRMIEPADGNITIQTCMQSFEPYILANKRTEKPVFHVSLNPDPKDVLTDEQLSQIAAEYMEKMGYGDQPFVVYKHEDIDRKHIHIVSLRVDENGKKIDHNFEHRRSMDVCRELEQKYGLIPADQKQRQDGLPLKPVNYDAGDIKHQIANVIRPLARDYHYLSLKEYKALLSLYNVGMEEIRGEVKGKQYQGIVYFALNENGEKAGSPFKSSLFGKTVGLPALEKRSEKSAEIIKDKRLKDRPKRVITEAIRNCNNRSDFEKTLQRQGISAIFRTNEEGRIYGATFIDHEQKCVFNGSRLGKEFSANVFNDLFISQNQPEAEVSEQPFIPQNQSDVQVSERSFNSQNTFSDEKENINTGFGGIFDLFTTESSASSDFDEQDFIRLTKKKRRPKQHL